MSLEVLYEDNHLLVVRKPPGLLAQGDRTGRENLLDLAKEHRKQAEEKPGRAFVGLVHRLDYEVGGVVVFAKTSKAAARLSEQFRSGSVRKVYLAVLELPKSHAKPEAPAEGVWEDHLIKDPDKNVSRIVPKGTRGAKPARTKCRRLAASRSLCLIELAPQTGRAHQLRVQAAGRGTPIVGDRKYGSRRASAGLALHAFSLSFFHPTRKRRVTFSCPPPVEWKRFGFRLPDTPGSSSDSQRY